MGGVRAVTVASAVLLVAMSVIGGPNRAQAVSACASDDLPQLMPAGAAVELLTARGPAIPAGRWPQYQALAAAVVACVGPRTHLAIRAIGPNSLASPPVFARTLRVEAGGVNSLVPLLAQRKFVADALAAVDTLARAHPEDDGTYDALGALAAAGADFSMTAPGAKRVVLMIFNGWLQSRSINIFSFASNPRRAASAVIARLRADDAMPDVHGSRVLIAGLTAGDPRMRIDDTRLAELCGFWTLIVEAAHGRLAACGASLPGVAVRSSLPH